MKRLSFSQRRWVVYARRTFYRHQRLIGIFVAGAILFIFFPILLIPVFGIALPLYGAWMTYKSFDDDKRRIAESQARKKRVEAFLEQSIINRSLINVPLKDGYSSCIGYVARVDADEITLFDTKNSEFIISWHDLDLITLDSRLDGKVSR